MIIIKIFINDAKWKKYDFDLKNYKYSISPKASADPASKLLPDNSKCSRPLLKLKLLAISIAFSSEIYFLHIFKCFRTVFCSTIFNKSLT